jgi:hypothetical protein
VVAVAGRDLHPSRPPAPTAAHQRGNRLIAWTRQGRVAVGRLPAGGSLSLDLLGAGHLSFGFALAGSIGLFASTGDTGHVLFASNRSGAGRRRTWCRWPTTRRSGWSTPPDRDGCRRRLASVATLAASPTT